MTFFKWVRRAVSQRVELLRELHHVEAMLGAHVFELDKAKRELARERAERAIDRFLDEPSDLCSYCGKHLLDESVR